MRGSAVRPPSRENTVTTLSTPQPAIRAGTPSDVPSIDALAINTIRTLSMDAVQAADSGHPGTPMSLAPVAYALWQHILNYDPRAPLWPNRDRFVLSNGHASMLIYSILHLASVQAVDEKGAPTGDLAVPLDDIKAFRQLNSRCPGHPEYRHTTGIETTTGPLGQGLATSVGMAIAERWLASHYNRPGYEIFNHRTWAICGDGCMMEGISSEAASLAAHLRLSNLCWIYDNNHITIEGSTSLAFSEDVATRFIGYGWNVMRVSDANDIDLLVKAYTEAAKNDRPTLIVVDSHIGWGSPKKQDTAAAHGEPLGEEEIKATKRYYGWPEDAKFLVPDGVRERFDELVGARGAKGSAAWNEMFARYRTAYPTLAAEIDAMLADEMPEGWDSALPTFPTDPKGVATRAAGGKILNAIAKKVPWVLGGSADLAPSTKTLLDGETSFEAGSYGGRNMHFGIREHAMCAIANGLALSKVRPFTAGFMIFSDYARGSIRLGALMELPVVHVLTHDSIGLGEDGPTHQPIEQLLALRAIPHMHVLRPMDANEAVECYRMAFGQTRHPCVMALSRQNLPTVDRSTYAPAANARRGAYVLADAGGDPQVILIGTGSEVSLCLDAHQALVAKGIRSRVVSMPCWSIFDAQDDAYRASVLPPHVRARVAVEQAGAIGWERYVGLDGAVIGMRSFGASAPIKVLQKHFGFTVDAVVAAAEAQVHANGGGA
ncbi:MAG: transketolase [Phycisphaerae bacterium]|nr:transketolase [Phycisphaerae bacterium]